MQGYSTEKSQLTEKDWKEIQERTFEYCLGLMRKDSEVQEPTNELDNLTELPRAKLTPTEKVIFNFVYILLPIIYTYRK